MKIYRGNYFSASLPNNWDAEYDTDDGLDVLYNPDGFGEIQISAVIHEEQLTPNDLMHIAEEDLHAGAILQELDLKELNGFWFDYVVDEEYWCEWYLCSGQLMLFATYSCPLKDEGKEFSEVDLIIRTLRPVDHSRPGA
ncbi:MAG: hypothetical protein H8E21_02860 [Gammaproteobacteria bacterium]|nr:hypothetical protein [Gammaproteobacteria bacterium]MBL6999097.1 hypothetical protein [Gammaproteobacteria bacterium]